MAKYKKGEYRDQFVIAHITDIEDYKDIVQWAEKFSLMLKKGLILLYISDEKYTTLQPNDVEGKLQQINSEINIPYSHSYAALKGNSSKIINSCGDLLNGVMIISKLDNSIAAQKNRRNPNNPKNLLNDYYSSRLAYFVFTGGYKNVDFKEVILSMNALRECKEKVLWASYFGRFACSRINIFYHRYRDEYLQKQLNLNIGFARKMFKNFDIETLNVHRQNRRQSIDKQAINFAENEDRDLCIIQTTKNKSILDYLFGSNEKKALKNLNNSTALLLNQRDDLFVMCE